MTASKHVREQAQAYEEIVKVGAEQDWTVENTIEFLIQEAMDNPKQDSVLVESKTGKAYPFLEEMAIESGNASLVLKVVNFAKWAAKSRIKRNSPRGESTGSVAPAVQAPVQAPVAVEVPKAPVKKRTEAVTQTLAQKEATKGLTRGEIEEQNALLQAQLESLKEEAAAKERAAAKAKARAALQEPPEVVRKVEPHNDIEEAQEKLALLEAQVRSMKELLGSPTTTADSSLTGEDSKPAARKSPPPVVDLVQEKPKSVLKKPTAVAGHKRELPVQVQVKTEFEEESLKAQRRRDRAAVFNAKRALDRCNGRK